MGDGVVKYGKGFAEPQWLPWSLSLGIGAIALVVLAVGGYTAVLITVGASAIATAVFFPRARLWVLIVLLPFSHTGIGIESLEGFGVYDIYNLLFILVFVWKILGASGSNKKTAVAVGASFVLALAFVPSVLNAGFTKEVIKSFVQLLVSAFTIAAVYHFLAEEDSADLVRNLLMFLVVESALIAIYGIYKAYTASSIVQVLTGRVYVDIFGEINYYAGYLAMVTAIALGFISTSRSGRSRIFFVLVSFALILGVVSTISRAAMGGMLVVIVLYLAFLVSRRESRRMAIFVSVMLAAIGVFLISSDVGNKLVDLVTVSKRVEGVLSGSDASLEQRETIVQVTLRMIRAHPIIGVGFGSFEDSFDSYKGANLFTGSARSAHNTVLRVLAETGIVGFLAFVFFLYVLFRELKTGYTAALTSLEKTGQFSIIVALIVFLVISLALDQLFEAHFWVIAGIGLAFAEIMKKRNRASLNNSR